MKTILILAALYGVLVGSAPKEAPYSVTVDHVSVVTRTLPEETANRLGFKMIEDNRPQTDADHYAAAIGWAETNRIYRVYEIKENPPAPPRRIYKYDLSTACIEYGEITNLITLISSDVGIKWMWDAAEILVENDPYFIAATNTVITEGIIAEEKVKRILDRAYELGQISAIGEK